MITATSKPTYTSKDQKLIVYETTIRIETEDSAELMAEFQAILKAILGNTQLKLDEAVRISEILAEESNTLSANVKRILEEADADQTTKKDR